MRLLLWVEGAEDRVVGEREGQRKRRGERGMCVLDLLAYLLVLCILLYLQCVCVLVPTRKGLKAIREYCTLYDS